jgi:hypothetical protein
MSLHSLIANGGKVLVVTASGDGSNAQRWLEFRNHPQLMFWIGEEKDIQRKLWGHNNMLPPNVRGVITTKYISHNLSGLINAAAKAKRAVMVPQLSNGEVRRVLEEIVSTPKPEPVVNLVKRDETGSVHVVKHIEAPPAAVAPVVEAPIEASPTTTETVVERTESVAKKNVTPKGALTAFVQAHDNRDARIGSEARRLLSLAKAANIHTTEVSLAHCIATVRRRSRSTAPIVEQTSARVAADVTNTPVSVPAAVTSPASNSRLLSLIDEAAAALQTSSAALQLLRDEITTFEASQAELVQVQATLARILGTGAR